ncbi:hypothetical protein SKAU_G00334330 [Synaphobranchus kaupii]|uniref:Uncharacterized protein n=1 Tax=Synaphobranchus kaupii TaxID=118154 RepID=A0A9Q1ELT0_SYNKA|nr:hypothetical protein SKAU_G00334330 [Synaphobranchus kaupii]
MQASPFPALRRKTRKKPAFQPCVTAPPRTSCPGYSEFRRAGDCTLPWRRARGRSASLAQTRALPSHPLHLRPVHIITPSHTADAFLSVRQRWRPNDRS